MKNKQLRNFAIASAIFLTLMLVGIFYYVNEQLRSEIEKAGEVSNATLTRVFVNETWTEISALLPPPGSSFDEIKLNPNIKKIDNRMRRFMSYTDVLKVKLYNTNGITTYSSDFDQIGENKTDNVGFQQALKGNLASELIYRGKFGAFDGQLYNRNLVSTYAPIRDGAQVIAVAEIYSDRTSSIAQALKLQNRLIVILIISMLILYSIMMLVARKIYLNMQLVVTKSTTSSGDAQSQLQPGNQASPIRLSIKYPMPELSLRGIEQVMQNLKSSSTAKSGAGSAGENEQSSSDLSKEATSIASRIAKYRMLQSDSNQAEQNTIALLNFDGLIKSITNYANDTAGVESIQFYQGQKFSNGFMQSENTIESVLTCFIDLISFGYAKSTIEIKLNGSNALLDIDLITSSNGPVNSSYSQLFHELDHAVTALALLQSFKYKATRSDKGILVSLSFTQL